MENLTNAIKWMKSSLNALLVLLLHKILVGWSMENLRNLVEPIQ